MKDPICGMEVAEPPKIKAQRDGVLYGFCSEGCRDVFESKGGGSPKTSYKTGYMILGGVFAAIVAFVIARRFFEGVFTAGDMMADFMGGFFVVFGVFKLLDWDAFVEAYATYDIIASKSRWYARAYPLLQITIGGAYLVRWAVLFVSGVTMVLMAVGAAGILRAIASGRKIRCACLGTRIALPMTTISFIEDALMVAMAGAVLLGQRLPYLS